MCVELSDLWSYVQVPDYYEVIEKPMDLTTIQKKMDNGRYTQPEEFVNDIDLMIVNSYQYNEVLVAIVSAFSLSIKHWFYSLPHTG